MAEDAKRIGAVMTHYSTDYVLDGSNKPSPQNIYGETKLAGEHALKSQQRLAIVGKA